MTLKGDEKFGPKLNPGSWLPNQPPKNSQFVWKGQKGLKREMFLLSFVWKVNPFNQKPSQEFYFVTLKGRGKFGLKLNPAFQITPKKLAQFVSSRQKLSNFHILVLFFVWKVNSFNQKPSQGFYFVTLKGHGKFGQKLNPAFQISPKEISQFVWSGRKGSKFQMLLLSFVWKVNFFNQKL